MAGYEYTCIVGNVGRDPEMRYTQTGTAVCSFSVAVTTRWTDRQSNERRERTNWYRISCWDRQAEIANMYIKKGKQVMVVGTVSASAYAGNDGQPRASLELRAQTFQMLGTRDDNDSGGGSSYDNDDDFSPPARNVDDIPF